MTHVLVVSNSLCYKFICLFLLGNPSVYPVVNVQNVGHWENVTWGTKYPAQVHEPYISCFVSDEFVGEETFNRTDSICSHEDYVLSHYLFAF